MHQQELFDGENNITKVEQSNQQRPRFHLHENSLINHKDAAETAIEIIAAKKPLTDLMLCRYLKQRRIDKTLRTDTAVKQYLSSKIKVLNIQP